MKTKIEITMDDTILFKGKILNMPVHHDAVIKRSIELFDDENPCIIHQSFVVKEFAEELITLFEENNPIEGKDYADVLKFLDVDDVMKIRIHKKG